MSLQLNEPRIAYREFLGRYNQQMPRLISEGRVPMSVADIMRRRLEVANSTPDVRAAWLDNYFDTSDGIAYHPNGKVKVVLDAVPLRMITTQNTLTNGALGIDAATYTSLPGEELRSATLTIGTRLTKRAVMNSPIWNALARDDKALLREYASLIFTDAKERFGYEENMPLYLSATPGTPSLRVWCVNIVYSGSALGGGNDLGSGVRLVGVAPSHATTVPR